MDKGIREMFDNMEIGDIIEYLFKLYEKLVELYNIMNELEEESIEYQNKCNEWQMMKDTMIDIIESLDERYGEDMTEECYDAMMNLYNLVKD